MNMIRNKGVSMLGVSMIVVAMGTASLAEVQPDQSGHSPIGSSVDVEAIARDFEKQAEYLDAIRYGVPSPVSVDEIALPIADTGQQAITAQIEDAKHALQENIQQHVGVSATDLAFDSYEINTNSPEKIQADLKYYATREVGDDGNTSTWKEEVVYGIEIDPTTGQITDVVNKDLDWIHANIPDEEVVIDDGLGSGDEGISTEEMKKLDQQSSARTHGM